MARSGGRSRRVWRPSAIDVVDVFVYVTVLSLAVEYVPAVISETFTVSLLLAVLLKLVLEVVVRVKSRVRSRWSAATTRWGKLVAGLGMWAVLVGSKFVLIELVALAFGDRVSLGGFLPVTGLVIALMLARVGVRRLLT